MSRNSFSEYPFLWGAATSSHQVEGRNIHNDWWQWETQGKLKEASGLACDHYNRFTSDFDILSSLGHNAHRFSLEWSRFEPQENSWSDEAFAHYDQVFRELKKRNIEPVVTLHHFTNPSWFWEKGGWLDFENIYFFNRYVKKMVEAYGKYVRIWITINEPLVYLYYGFFSGQWPPGIKSFEQSKKVFRVMLHAHITAYQQIHQLTQRCGYQRPYVSIAKHVSFFQPCRENSFWDKFAVNVRHYFFNHLFLDAIQSGFLFFPGVFCELLPGRNAMDFIGVNYYMRDFIRFNGISSQKSLVDVCDKAHHGKQVSELNFMGWDVYPQGLCHLLMGLKKYDLPLLVTENGICSEDDEQRQRFIHNHLEEVKSSMSHGANVVGYLYWSLLDNFEWAHGFAPRFGIVGVDYQTQERKIRESAQVLSDSCRKLFSRK